MLHQMRRSRQVLAEAECLAVLERAITGVLAVSGEEGYPYAVPLNYVYYDGAIYFHCAKAGHKIDAITKDDKVSFCVIDKDTIVPERYTTYFRSVIVFGRAHIVEDEAEIRRALDALAEKYWPEHGRGCLRSDEQLTRVCVLRLSIDRFTGKEAIELVRERNGENPAG